VDDLVEVPVKILTKFETFFEAVRVFAAGYVDTHAEAEGHEHEADVGHAHCQLLKKKVLRNEKKVLETKTKFSKVKQSSRK
jgi:hypothetical protein